MAQTATSTTRPSQEKTDKMIFLFHYDPAFIEGLRRHDLLHNYGFRLLNTGFDRRSFRERWTQNPALEGARTSNLFYYIDRITGGMPYQNLDGIEAVAGKLKGDPRFLGFQVHEWGNSPIHDYHRIYKLLLDKELPFDYEHFAVYQGRTVPPYFSSGDYHTYQRLFEPLHTLEDVVGYHEGYFRQIIKRTWGQVVAVNGYIQLYHTALRLGAKNVMAEIGNQVPLTALQIACVRGAAREFGKPFGVYYEPWGGKPFGCPCALGYSPWFGNKKDPDGQDGVHRIRPGLGSSRSLQRRLLFFAWLSGATYWAEEWGAENYFGNWQDYPLTQYGQIVKEFLEVSSPYNRPEPMVPAVIIMPPGAGGIDLRYLFGEREQLYGLVGPDQFHVRLRQFAKDVFAARSRRYGADDFNLTPSPWIGCFDVLSVEAPEALLSQYGLVIYFDQEQAERSTVERQRVFVYQGNKQDSERCMKLVSKLLPVLVEGEVGCVQARGDGKYFVGVFNNLGVIKTEGNETTDSKAVRSVIIHLPEVQVDYLVGAEYVAGQKPGMVEMSVPSGSLAIIAFPDHIIPSWRTSNADR
ncbi:MAG: hypothetical protein JSV03_07245 [Planctomycetota bacterium]|nr:MAG: hypothetical protein JSV03_07245 [Planctomycetota bacterium]